MYFNTERYDTPVCKTSTYKSKNRRCKLTECLHHEAQVPVTQSGVEYSIRKLHLTDSCPLVKEEKNNPLL